MLVLVAIVSHTAADAGYVLVIPLGGVIFYAAGRHPLAGIAAAFAGVSGGFSANFVPSGLDPLLQGLTLRAAPAMLDPNIVVNTLNNYFFTTAVVGMLIIGLGWWITDRVRRAAAARHVEIDGDAEDLPEMHDLADNERRGMCAGPLVAMVGGLVATGCCRWCRPTRRGVLRQPPGADRELRRTDHAIDRRADLSSCF